MTVKFSNMGLITSFLHIIFTTILMFSFKLLWTQTMESLQESHLVALALSQTKQCSIILVIWILLLNRFNFQHNSVLVQSLKVSLLVRTYHSSIKSQIQTKVWQIRLSSMFLQREMEQTELLLTSFQFTYKELGHLLSHSLRTHKCQQISTRPFSLMLRLLLIKKLVYRATLFTHGPVLTTFSIARLRTNHS